MKDLLADLSYTDWAAIKNICTITVGDILGSVLQTFKYSHQFILLTFLVIFGAGHSLKQIR